MTWATVSARGAAATTGQPDLSQRRGILLLEPGIVSVRDTRGNSSVRHSALPGPKSGCDCWSAAKCRSTAQRWRSQFARCRDQRAGIDANAWRAVHGEGDGLPALIVDR